MSELIAKRSIGLYIHFPWCVRKCPYCDFNSHEVTPGLNSNSTGSDENSLHESYLQALLKDLHYEQSLWQDQNVQIKSIFIGGGTPSLASGQFYKTLLQRVADLFELSPDLEVTMEANPGALEYDRFDAYLEAGINRLSLGVQSFSAPHLKGLGRIHSAEQGLQAYKAARAAGFQRINIDLMFGLAEQSVQQGLDDVSTAIALDPEHISWYQLTIEPNTAFYSQPPILDIEKSHELWDAGRALLSQSGFSQYEVSAYAKPGEQSRHNVLYWTFGDYAAIGAGAHGKLTRQVPGQEQKEVWRYNKTRLPAHYIARQHRIPLNNTDNSTPPPAEHPFTGQAHVLQDQELHFEYLLNKLRLAEPLHKRDYEAYTGRQWSSFMPKLQHLESLGYLTLGADAFTLTQTGFAFLDDLMTRLE